MLRQLVTVCVCAAAFVGLAQVGDVLVTASADAALLNPAYGNSAEWSGTSRKPHEIEFTVAYTADVERSVTFSVAEGTHAEQVAHAMVVAWASAHCDRPVYHEGTTVIFPASGGISITNMKVKITESATAAPIWRSLGAYDATPPPDLTRVYWDDFVNVKNANR
jgi:hypothetical protein